MATLRVRNGAELGSAVRAARMDAGLSQAELASEASVGRQWLVELEAGDKSSAPFDMVMRVLRALAVDVTLDSSVPPDRRRRAEVDGSAPAPKASDVLARYTRTGGTL